MKSPREALAGLSNADRKREAARRKFERAVRAEVAYLRGLQAWRVAETKTDVNRQPDERVV